MNPPTGKQIDYVRSIQRKLHLSSAVLDGHCARTYRAPLAGLDRQQVSHLLDTIVGWEAVPADLQRAMGQTDLFANPEGTKP